MILLSYWRRSNVLNLYRKQASDLSELVSEMRAILMEELESGIPEQTLSVASPDSSENESASTVSSYQQMLAKARAKKNTSA
jgi:hypothetical protein